MTSATPRPCSRGSSRVPLSLLTKLTTRIASAPISELEAPFPTSPTAPTAGGSPGGQRLFIASATMSNASSTSSSSTAGLPPATISLAPPSSLSSNSPPCEFGFDQLSPRPSNLLNLVWLWFRSPHVGLAARMMRTSETPHEHQCANFRRWACAGVAMWSRPLALALLLLPAPALADVKEKVAVLAPPGLVLVMDAEGNELVAQNTDE